MINLYISIIINLYISIIINDYKYCYYYICYINKHKDEA